MSRVVRIFEICRRPTYQREVIFVIVIIWGRVSEIRAYYGLQDFRVFREFE
jgi:hypothetical protein